MMADGFRCAVVVALTAAVVSMQPRGAQGLDMQGIQKLELAVEEQVSHAQAISNTPFKLVSQKQPEQAL